MHASDRNREEGENSPTLKSDDLGWKKERDVFPEA